MAAAAELLIELGRSYEALVHYEDEGILTTTCEVGVARRFQTFFERGRRLTFDFSAPNHGFGYELAADLTEGGTVSLRHLPDGKSRTELDLGLAVAAMTGVSLTTAHTIPRLLLPQILGWSILDLVAPTFDSATLQLSGAHPILGTAITLVVDTVRCLVSSVHSGGVGTNKASQVAVYMVGRAEWDGRRPTARCS